MPARVYWVLPIISSHDNCYNRVVHIWQARWSEISFGWIVIIRKINDSKVRAGMVAGMVAGTGRHGWLSCLITFLWNWFRLNWWNFDVPAIYGLPEYINYYALINWEVGERHGQARAGTGSTTINFLKFNFLLIF